MSAHKGDETGNKVLSSLGNEGDLGKTNDGFDGIILIVSGEGKTTNSSLVVAPKFGNPVQQGEELKPMALYGSR